MQCVAVLRHEDPLGETNPRHNPNYFNLSPALRHFAYQCVNGGVLKEPAQRVKNPRSNPSLEIFNRTLCPFLLCFWYFLALPSSLCLFSFYIPYKLATFSILCLSFIPTWLQLPLTHIPQHNSQITSMTSNNSFRTCTKTKKE